MMNFQLIVLLFNKFDYSDFLNVSKTQIHLKIFLLKFSEHFQKVIKLKINIFIY